MPLSFEENRGQTDARVKFLARGRGYTVFLTATEAVLKLGVPWSPTSARRQTPGKLVSVGLHSELERFALVRIRLEGADPDSEARGVERLPGRTNYFIGNDPAKWRTSVPTFAGAEFRGIYPGIDLVYRGTAGRLEYDLVVAAGADPKRIKLRVEGAESLALTSNGDLVIKTARRATSSKRRRSSIRRRKE